MPRYSLSIGNADIPIAETNKRISKELGRRLQQASPSTLIDSGGSVNQSYFSEQSITQDELRDIKQMRESGGIVAELMHLKALMNFGGGVTFDVQNNEESVVEQDGEEQTLEEWLNDTFDDIDSLILDLGKDALWYPYSACEVLETRAGGFSHIEPVQPWTLTPQTDDKGQILRWIQETKDGSKQAHQPSDITHFPLHKSSARDKTGISSVLQSEHEITQFRKHQHAINSAIEMHGFPQRHVKVGREGAAPIRDNELRRVRNLFDSRTVDSDTVFVTGQDVDIDTLEAENFDFTEVTENDIRQLALALGLPLELTNYGSDGLGSGKPAEFRMEMFKLQVKANQRNFCNIFIRDLLRPILEKYTRYDHQRNITMEIDDPLTTDREMAEIISKVGSFYETNEAREKLGLEPKEDLEGEYGKAATEQPPQPQGQDGIFAQTELADIADKYTENTELTESDFVPNQDVQDTVDEVLEFIDQNGLPNPDNQSEGATRANQLQNYAEDDEPLAFDYWQEIYNYHNRHRAQGNHQCDESSVDAEDVEGDFDKCYLDPGWFSSKTWGGDAGFEQAERIVTAVEDSEIEASDGHGHGHGDINFSNLPPWDRDLMQMHQQIWESGDKRLLDVPNGTETPEFVKERIRESILSGSIFNDFETVAGSDLQQLREYMLESLTDEGWTIDGVADQLMQLDGVESQDRAELIARTETASVVNSAREEGYQANDQADDKFYWTGAIDDRTTDACEWLIRQTNPNYGGTPVQLKDLQDLIAEAPEHDDSMQDDLARPKNYVVHPNERKTFTRAPSIDS
ncbi:hypothetical protein OSG_eHP24_00055 [environmental Halophage eHP-24]|nr:hypothetical protein OSG_eHP24_00055 [environmental Halophage eHP-24]